MYITGNNVNVGTNAGQMRITGTGVTVGTNTNTGTLYSSQTLVMGTNNGRAWIIGSNSSVTTNTGHLRIDGDGANVDSSFGSGANALINGNNATVGFNNALMRIVGNLATITLNGASGQARIQGENATVHMNNGGLGIDGDFASIGANNGSARINGNDATVTNNNSTGLLHVVGDVLDLTNNSGRARAEGLNTTITNNNATGQEDINGTAHFVSANRGSIRLGLLSVRGHPVPNGPHPLTEVTFGPPDTPPAGGNFGRIDVLTGGTVSRLPFNTNTGEILVFNGGNFNDITHRNEGRIHVENGGRAQINVNINEAVSLGVTVMVENRGYFEVGEWKGEWNTPAIGSSAGMGSIASTNYGVIRNFSAHLEVVTTAHTPLATPIWKMPFGGIIENYGSLNPQLPNRPQPVILQPSPPNAGFDNLVRHHARHIDVSGIVAGTGTTISFTVNGGGGSPWANPFAHRGGAGWTPDGDKQILNFNPYMEDGGFFLRDGWVIFNANHLNEIQDVLYYIPEMSRFDIAGSEGTSGRWLQFEALLPFKLQVGANSGQMMHLRFRSIYTHHLARSAEYVTFSETNVLTRQDATEALASASRALLDVTEYRTELGANHNRLELTIRSLGISSENLQDAESRVRNADMAREMMDFAMMNVLFQSGMAMLAQANQLPNNVLALLNN